MKRPVTGRNAFVEIEGEDYDGQSAVTKGDSNDTSLGQAITGSSGSTAYFESVDFSDAGVGAVQLRVAAPSATTLELHADSQTGPLLGTCAIAATGAGAAWATQTCTLTPTTGVHRLYLVFRGAMSLNWMKFQAAPVSTGTGGAGGGAGGSAAKVDRQGGAAPVAAPAPARAAAAAAAVSGAAASGSAAPGMAGVTRPASGAPGVTRPGAAAPGVIRPGTAGTGSDPSGTAGTGTAPRGAPAIPARADPRRPPPVAAAARATSAAPAGRRRRC